MMSRGLDDFTEEELLRISRPVDPSTLPKGRDSDWIKSDDGKCCRDHYMFTKYIDLVGTTIFDSEIDLYAKTFIMAM